MSFEWKVGFIINFSLEVDFEVNLNNQPALNLLVCLIFFLTTIHFNTNVQHPHSGL